MKHLHTEIQIEAGPAEVWAVLTDFARYADWNPFLVPGRVLEWWGHLGIRGIFDGRHRFELSAHGTGTRLVQRETFTGLLVPLMARTLDGPTAAGFALMNEALRTRAERQQAGVHD